MSPCFYIMEGALKTRVGFVSNSSSSSFILPKKDLTLEQLRAFSSWVNIHNNSNYSIQDGHVIHETNNYYFGSVSYHCGLKDQLLGLGIQDTQYDIEG